MWMLPFLCLACVHVVREAAKFSLETSLEFFSIKRAIWADIAKAARPISHILTTARDDIIDHSYSRSLLHPEHFVRLSTNHRPLSAMNATKWMTSQKKKKKIGKRRHSQEMFVRKRLINEYLMINKGNRARHPNHVSREPNEVKCN